jgi:hypothetical protein
MARKAALIVLLAGVCLTVVGCSLSIAGGILGGVLTVLVSASLIFGAGFTQSGCSDSTDGSADSVNPCLSIIEDTTDPDIGPCLTPPLDTEDPDIGPCLSPRPDTEEPDVGPCLSQPAPDSDDPEVGPCLSAPADDTEGPKPIDSQSLFTPQDAGDLDRQSIQERLIANGIIPEDVANKLKDKTEDV